MQNSSLRCEGRRWQQLITAHEPQLQLTCLSTALAPTLTVVCQGAAVLQLLASEDQALLVRGDALLVLQEMQGARLSRMHARAGFAAASKQDSTRGKAVAVPAGQCCTAAPSSCLQISCHQPSEPALLQ